MSKGHLFLEQIYNELQMQDSHFEEYAEDYFRIREYILKKLCEEPAFKMIFGEICQFETAYRNLPDEKEVMIVLDLPASSGMNVELSEDCPGFVTFNYLKGLQHLRATHHPLLNVMDGLMDTQKKYLSRMLLKDMLEKLLEGIYNCNPVVKGVLGDKWSLKLQDGNPLKVEAKTNNGKRLSMNFVFAIRLYGHSWPFCKTKGLCETKNDYWFVCSTTPFDCFASKDTEFLVLSPRAEILKLQDKPNIKPVFRLLRAFLDKKGLFRIENYYLRALFLQEIDSQHCDLWIRSIDQILSHMIKRLREAIEKRQLGYYWVRRLNVFQKFNDNDLKQFEQILNESYQILNNCLYGDKVILEECRSLFLETKEN